MLKLLPKSINIFNSLLMSVCLYFFLCVCVNEHPAVISQLSKIVMSYQQHTTTIVTATEGEKFLKNAKSLCHTIEEIPDNILKIQYNMFLEKLLEIYNAMSQDELNEIKSIDVIKRFLRKNEKLYEGIEFIMHSISAACVAISVESIVESVVSIYETRQTKSRTLSDDRANYEMQIGYNGPDLAKADTMLKKAMDSYFKAHKQGKWHFTIDPNRLEHTVSKVVDKKIVKSSKMFFMDT